MTRTYQKGRIFNNGLRGFKRNSRGYTCHCDCCWEPRKKAMKKTAERNQLKALMDEYIILHNRIKAKG